jgi:glucuronosyltransferase
MQRYSVAVRYRENAQRLSRIFRDQPLTQLEQAVYWTEYVIRHNGAPHLRSAVLCLAWYQYFLLDVIAVLALAIVSVLLFLLLVCRVILKCVFGSKSQEESTESRRKKLN